MIFLDTNVVSESFKPSPDPLVVEWLIRHDAEFALPSVTLAELACGIEIIRPDPRALRLERGLAAWRKRFRDRIFSFTEAEALAYGKSWAKPFAGAGPCRFPTA